MESVAASRRGYRYGVVGLRGSLAGRRRCGSGVAITSRGHWVMFARTGVMFARTGVVLARTGVVFAGTGVVLAGTGAHVGAVIAFARSGRRPMTRMNLGRLVIEVNVVVAVGAAHDLRLLQWVWYGGDAQNEHEKGDGKQDAHFALVVRSDYCVVEGLV